MRALHVDHGLSPHAGRWSIHCADFAHSLAIDFESVRVFLTRATGQSVEAIARDARYEALFSLCQKHGAAILMTAHNATDQAETVLLNLSRGSGIAGAAGMARVRAVGDVILARPFLGLDAEDIRARLREFGTPFIEDESNLEHRFRRNALRHRIMPALREIMPGVVENLGRAAQHAGRAQDLLDEIGHEDLEILHANAQGFALDGLSALSHLRASNALRCWFRRYRVHAPSAAQLSEMLDQLLQATGTQRLALRYLDEILRVEGGRVMVSRLQPQQGLSCPPRILRWSDESALDLPEWGGRLVFESAADRGIPRSWLREQTLCLRGRAGGERLKLHDKRPSRTLKNLFQEQNISERLRDRLPLLFADELLVFAAGLGTDVRAQTDCATSAEALVHLRWEMSELPSSVPSDPALPAPRPIHRVKLR